MNTPHDKRMQIYSIKVACIQTEAELVIVWLHSIMFQSVFISVVAYMESDKHDCCPLDYYNVPLTVLGHVRISSYIYGYG